MFGGAGLQQTSKGLMGPAGGGFEIPCAHLSQLLTHAFREVIRVSRGAEGRGGVRGLKRHHGKINDSGGKRPRRNVMGNVSTMLSLLLP
jgi:hypothetical protein